MRLGTCVAIELCVGGVVAAGVCAVALLAVAELGAGLGAREAQAAEASSTPVPRLSSELPRLVDHRADPAAVAGLAPLAAPRPGTGWFAGQADEVLLAPLRTGAVTSVKFNRGGSSVSLRLDFDNGARAAFKPNQINLQTVPRKEIAAYRIARLLGLSNVAPALGRRFAVADLAAHLRPDSRGLWPRFLAEATHHGGFIDGELSFWIPVIEDARIAGFPIDSTDGVVSWKRYLTVGNSIPDADLVLVQQISDMVLFDFVVNNPDRWSGNNTKTSADRGTLYFMDNAMALAPGRGHSKVRTYLERSQKFSRRLVERLRALDGAGLLAATAWSSEPFRELATEAERAAVLLRRDAALAYVDRLIAAHGEAAVLEFP